MTLHNIWLMCFYDPYIASLPSRAPKMVPMVHMKEEIIRPTVNMSLGFRDTSGIHLIVGSC